jgi:hypothetical protein
MSIMSANETDVINTMSKKMLRRVGRNMKEVGNYITLNNEEFTHSYGSRVLTVVKYMRSQDGADKKFIVICGDFCLKASSQKTHDMEGRCYN